MNESNHTSYRRKSRREFLQLSGGAAAASALAGVAVPYCHAGGDGTIKLALVGCGNRGTGAVANALSTTGGPVKLYAMADMFGSARREATTGSRGPSATGSTCRPNGSSWASTPTGRPSIACGPATWRC